MRLHTVLTTALLLLAAGTGPRVAAQSAGAVQAPDSAAFSRIDQLINDGMAAGQLPGAVVLIGQGDRIVFEKAYGFRALEPAREPMTLDTIFDMASLTKVVATTSAVMSLVEQGRIRLNDPVARYIPGFARHGKDGITIRHLMTHVSGLRPDLDLGEHWTGSDTAIELACDEVPTSPPGERFVYSDINYFLLGDIVRRVSGETLDVYTKRAIFTPLGMVDTGFLPAAALRPRIAPTERCAEFDAWPCKRPEAEPLRGVVHDPTARRMGGVAGHAGLFSTAHDMSRFARMLLGGGALGNVRVLSAAAVRRMTSPATPPGMTSIRGLGWDIDTSYSSNRGDLYPVGTSYGHTGFTGTSIWVDPASQSYVIFLSSRVHPDGAGDVTALRGRVATVAAAAFSGGGAAVAAPFPDRSTDVRRPFDGRSTSVLAGVDVLARDGFKALQGKRVGLLTNHTGRARDGRSTIDVIHEAKGVTLVSLFSPEHGIRGILDADVPSTRDDKTGLPIHSLYGATQRPTDAMLADIDTIVIDLQDVGARFYTYMTAMAYVMEEAAARKIAVVVLDRPNPIDGWQIEGPKQTPDLKSYIAYFPMPVRHGLTMGELAKLFNEENHIGVELTVVAMEGWQRDDWFDQTGLAWVNPSPNMRNLTQATLYPGIGSIEYGNVSVGRGTDQPFEQIGAPWIDGPRLAAALNARHLPGISFYPVSFTPSASKYAGEACQGVYMVVTNRQALQPVRLGIEMASALFTLFGDQFKLDTSERLLGSRESFARIKAGEDPADVAASWSADEAAWRRLRAKYLLYR